MRLSYEKSLKKYKNQALLFKALFNSAPECVKLQDSDGKIQRINAAGLALLDTSNSNLVVGKSVYNVISPEYHHRYKDLTQRVFSGETAVMEFELITLQGRKRWLETHAVPLRDESGNITSLLAITRDIDENKRVTQQLEEQRSRLSTIIESEPECVKLQNRSGVIQEMNPAGLSLLRAENPKQVIGHTIYEFIKKEYHEPYRKLTESVFMGKKCSMEFEVTTINGKHHWLETHAAPLRNNVGEVTALLAVTRDIDGRKKYEEKLKRHHNELAHVCRLNTLGELTSGLSHELNQPLCAISSYAESAIALRQDATDCNPEKLDEILEKIISQTERASGIIQRLRRFIRKKSPVAKANQPKKLVTDVMDFVDSDRRRYGIKIILSVKEVLPDIWVDRIQIEQVLLNLISNAMQATSKDTDGNKEILIALKCEKESIRISIRDYADGVSESLRPNLFKPFVTTKPDGLGMGLSLSRNITIAHGGQLTYEPENPGSTFHVLLPCVSQAA